MSFRPTCSDDLHASSAQDKAVALLSGGLDSVLAIYLVKRQGIDITAIHFTSFFSPLKSASEDSPVETCAKQLDVPVVYLAKGQDFLDIIRNPRYGHGKNINPCIDCRIYTLKKAKQFMQEIGASFIITGEVVGQRPMSQRKHTIRLIEKQAGCDGIILRPLSAKLLPVTRPEEDGIIDRALMLDIAGRGRKVQLQMAKDFGLAGFSAPAGGCLLTDKNFSGRVRDLLAHCENISPDDLAALRIGRHIRIGPGLKVVVGRDEMENLRLEELQNDGTFFFPGDFVGPSILAPGGLAPLEELLIGRILLRYTKPSRRGHTVVVRCRGKDRSLTINHPAGDDWIAEHLIL
jgi:tRNA-uridine 2-sulfurtransferase